MVMNGLSNIGQEERIDFKIFGTKKVVTLRNWSEVYISKAYEPEVQVTPTEAPETLLEACRKAILGEDAFLVSFEEGLKVQHWIDELLK